jgi:hypothetical protein
VDRASASVAAPVTLLRAPRGRGGPHGRRRHRRSGQNRAAGRGRARHPPVGRPNFWVIADGRHWPALAGTGRHWPAPSRHRAGTEPAPSRHWAGTGPAPSRQTGRKSRAIACWIRL